MKHLGTLELETERLILRRIKSSDAKPMFDNWASDDEVTKYLTWPTHSSVDVSKEVISEWIQNYSDNKFYQWVIALKDNVDEPIGSISVVHMDDDIDMVHIGYCIGRKWWHQGVTSEAFKEVIRFLIEEVGAKRIESRHDSNNPNSGKVMLKCGLQYEGTLRNSDRNNQGICNSVMYGLLAEDYYKEKATRGKYYLSSKTLCMEKEKLHKIKQEVFYYANNFKPKRKTVTRRSKEP